MTFLTVTVVHRYTLKLGVDRSAVFSLEFYFAFQHDMLLQNQGEMTGKNLPPLRIGNKSYKWFIGQQQPLDSKQLHAGEI